MMDFNFVRLIFFCNIFLLSMNAAFAAKTDQIGWVQSVENNNAELYIVRHDKKLNPKILMPIFVGDKIVLASNNKIEIQVGKQLIRLDKHNSPYVVSEVSKQETIQSRLLDWSASFFNGGSKNLLSTVSAVSRSVDPAAVINAPLLNYPLNKIIQRNELSLSWMNGVAPFNISIQSETNSSINVSLDNIMNREVSIDISMLKPGAYIILLSDINEQKKFILKISAKNERPTLSEKLPCSSEEQCEIFLALDLIYRDNQEWLLESFQIVSQYADENMLAREIRSQLQ